MKDESSQLCTKWAEQLIKRWMDQQFQISVESLRNKGWSALPLPDLLNPMEAEWISEALSDKGLTIILGVRFDYMGNPLLDKVENHRDIILNYIGMNSHLYVLLTDPDESFLLYKEQGNQFCLICGDTSFLARSYRCSYDTAKIMFIDYWADNDLRTKEERLFLTNVWDKYAIFKPI